MRIAQNLFVTLTQFGVTTNPEYTGELPNREGIFVFDVDTGLYNRRAPLHYQHYAGTFRSNFGTYLAGDADDLIFQGYPAYVRFDVTTLRILQRYPALESDLGREWVLQGPIVPSDREGQRSRILGLPLCLYQFVSWEMGPNRCAPTAFPGLTESLTYGSDRTLFRREVDADQPVIELARDLRLDLGGSLDTYRYANPVLSYDPARGGLWFAQQRGLEVSLFPIADHSVGARTFHASLSLPEVGGYPGRLFSWFYHPPLDRFFAVLTGVIDQHTPLTMQFASFDTDLHMTKIFATKLPGEQQPGTPIPQSFAAVSGTPPSAYEQAVPIIAETTGQNGTRWSSELWLFNPSGQATTVAVRRVAAPTSQRIVALAAHTSVRIPDTLAWAGGGPSGDGVTHDALVLTAPYRWGEQLVAVSRSSTPAPEPELRTAGGTLGHAVTAVPTRLGYTNHLGSLDPMNRATSIGWESLLLLDRRDPSRFRHNLGVVNDTDEAITVTLRWGQPLDPFTDPAPEGAVQTLTVPARSVKVTQVEPLFPPSIRDGSPPKIAIAASKPCIVWLSMVDNTTGDATFVPFTQLFLLGDDSFRAAVPVAAHTAGEKGTYWQTDLYGFHWDELNYWEGSIDEDRPKAWFHPARPNLECGGLPAGGELRAYLDGTVGMPIQDWIEANTYPGYPPPTAEQVAYTWRTVFPDVVRLFPECAAEPNVRGALELRTGSWMSAYSRRTYTTRSDGGTYGEMLPLYPHEGWPVQHFAGIEVSSRFRINLGLFNGNEQHPLTHRLLLYASDGTLAAQRDLVLQPWQSVQERLETLLGIPVGSLPEGTYGLTVLPLDDDEAGVPGRSWAYVSLVDNVTGDPTNWW